MKPDNARLPKEKATRRKRKTIVAKMNILDFAYLD